MLGRFSSIDWKFPALMSGIVILITAMLVRLAYVQFTGVLYESSGRRMEATSSMVASLISGAAQSRRAQLLQIAADPAILQHLRTGEGDESAIAAIARVQGAAADSQRSRVELLAVDGTTTLALRSPTVMASAEWAPQAVASGAVRNVDVELSPILDVQGIPHYQLVAPVRARMTTSSATPLRGPVEVRRDSVVGYLVETRALSGRALEALRDMSGGGTLLLGSERGAWTDFVELRPPPPPVARYDTAFRFAASSRGRGLGVAKRVAGTPWVVWLERPHSNVIAPVSDFVARAAPLAIAVALLGVLLAWVFGRRITHRIVLLTRKVEALEAGPPHHDSAHADPAPAQKRERDEIAHLEHAFTRMAERVETQQQLEAQLSQSQKLEAIGRLAGGIAHDFNNVLTVISNYSELVQSELVPGSAASRDLDQVLSAAERAARLTRQLLAFSRQQIISPQRLDLNELIDGAQRMLGRLIPSNIELVTELDQDIAPINADPGQIDQVLFNLILNAADAMPKGGRVTIRTLMADLDETFARGEDRAPAGRHVCLVVRDTGVGMDRETRERIFEPFFTTKPLGEGTGLGLPTVHGIVTQSGGRLWVTSEPGVGTTFKIFFPALEGAGAPEEEPMPATTGESPSARGTILLVEDDDSTREVTRRLLERQGFEVLQEARGAAALNTLGSEASRVDLVLTDVMMPGMSGVDLAEAIANRWPKLPVLLMSGYSDVDLRGREQLGREIALIEKPFTSAALFGAIHEALNGTG